MYPHLYKISFCCFAMLLPSKLLTGGRRGLEAGGRKTVRNDLMKNRPLISVFEWIIFYRIRILLFDVTLNSSFYTFKNAVMMWSGFPSLTKHTCRSSCHWLLILKQKKVKYSKWNRTTKNAWQLKIPKMPMCVISNRWFYAFRIVIFHKIPYIFQIIKCSPHILKI